MVRRQLPSPNSTATSRSLSLCRNPCNGAPGTIAATANTGFEHETYFTTAGPEFWFTSTAEGTATLTPDDSTGVSASGHFTEWFGGVLQQQNDIQHNTSTLT